MQIPTHTYQGQPVTFEDGLFLDRTGKPLRGPGIKKSDFIPVEPVMRELTQSQMGLVMMAANRSAGSVASNYHGDIAVLVSERTGEPKQVKLSIADRQGNNRHYLIDVPDTFDVKVLVLEEAHNGD